jgi:hypothetical protein
VQREPLGERGSSKDPLIGAKPKKLSLVPIQLPNSMPLRLRLFSPMPSSDTLSPRTHDPLDELLGDTYTPRDIQIQTPLYPLHSGTLFQVTAHELKLKLPN